MFAATDLQAIGILRAARDLGLRVPKDLAILGFDDLDAAEYVGLTTISQHLDESGRVAVELLLSRLVDPARSIQHIQLPLTIVERETT
jgi:LacI family transcriptional regulator